MNDLAEITFRKTEPKDVLGDFYSYFLNELIKARYAEGYTTKIIAKMFECSPGKINNFEQRVKDRDWDMLNNYAGFLGYELTMFLNKKNKYSQKR